MDCFAEPVIGRALRDPLARNDEHHDNAGLTAGAGRCFGPHRVSITLTQDSTPSNTIEAAASMKKFCCGRVVRRQPPAAGCR